MTVRATQTVLYKPAGAAFDSMGLAPALRRTDRTNWFRKQPLRTSDSDRTPYTTERALLLDLAEALAEIEEQ